MSQQITRTEQLKPAILGIGRQVESLLMNKDKAKKFLAASLVVASDKALMNCSPDSIAQALVGVAMSDLNIDRNLGQCYLVPYKDQCQLQISYKGMIQLMFRAGWFCKAFPVYFCDHFSMSFDGWDNKIDFQPSIDDREEGSDEWCFNNLRGIYVIARNADTKDEFSLFVNKKVIEKLRKLSPNQRSLPKYPEKGDPERLAAGLPIGIWWKFYVEMAQAKAIKKVAKLLPIGDSRVQNSFYTDDIADRGSVVDYIKTAESGVITELEPEPKQAETDSVDVNDFINGTVEVHEETVDQETGEITDILDKAEMDDITHAIKDCESLADLAKLRESIRKQYQLVDPIIDAKIKERQVQIKQTK